MNLIKHRNLLSRFSFIIILTLILPTISIAVILDLRMRDSQEKAIQRSLRMSEAGFQARLEHEQEILANHVGKISSIKELREIVSGDVGTKERLALGRLLFSLQLDGSIAWLPSDFPERPMVGSSILDSMHLKGLTDSAAASLPIDRILVDAQGLTLVQFSAEMSAPKGRFVVQRHLNRRDLQTLMLSTDQEFSLLDGRTGQKLFTTRVDSAGQILGLDEIRPPSRVKVDKPFGREQIMGSTWYTLYFSVPGSGASRLIGEVAIPEDGSLFAESARSFVTIATAILLLIIISSFILTQSVISPIVSLSYAVDSMRLHLKNNGPLVTIPIKNHDEVGHLATSINELGREIRASSELISHQRAEIVAYAHSLEERVQSRTRELEDARMRAEIANRHKSKFLVNMNHELRTPLNSITGITDLLRFGAYEKHEEIAAVLAETARLLAKNKGVPAELTMVFEALQHGLETETDGTRILLDYLNTRLTSLNIVIDKKLAATIAHALDLCGEEDRQLFRAYNTIRDAGDSLLSIIDEVINLSRIESGVINIEPAKVRLADILNNCMVHAEAYARTKRKYSVVSLSREIDQGVPEFVVLDAQKFKQVLLNLLTNAVKYTNEGYVHCRIGLVVQEETTFLHCSVQDSGRGIPEKDREFMFMEFGRSFEVREIEGTGLGLAFSRKIIERHGGTMAYHSREGDGSTFWFTLPLVLAPD